MDIKKGTKVSDADKANIDRSKIAVLISQPQNKDVEGQALYNDVFMCPYCGNVGWMTADTDVYMYGVCGNCGGTFQY